MDVEKRQSQHRIHQGVAARVGLRRDAPQPFRSARETLPGMDRGGRIQYSADARGYSAGTAGEEVDMRFRRAARCYAPAALTAGTLLLAFGPVRAEAGSAMGGTPSEMVATYNTLADAILAVEKTEENLVRSILGAAYAHSRIQAERARQAIKGGDAKAVQAALENLAAAVAQLATEGDSAVGAVRKRLLEGGHHHNVEGEAKGVYDEGYVVVTRAAKQAFLDSSRAIAALARAPRLDALEAEWRKVEATWTGLMK
jgi:hypothetical protein